MEKIIKWIKNNARPLEKSLYLYFFEMGSKNNVLYELMNYQNEDGGYGHGLEPDFRNPESNPIDSWRAARILNDLRLDQRHPMIIDLIEYFLHTEYKDDWMYYYTIPSNNDYPHAPWWHYSEERKISAYNPTAAILGFLYKYMEPTHTMYKTIEKALDQAIKYLMENQVTDMHELVCFNEMYEYICEDFDCSQLHQRLLDLNVQAIEQDDSKWYTTYSAKPTQVFVSMHSPGAKELMPLIHKELSLANEHKNQQGVYDITWEWNQYPKAFKQAKKEWMGILALKMLRVAKEYQYIRENE